MTPPTLELSPSLSAAVLEDDSDIFGPPRSNIFRSNRPRVSMISAKLRAKEERKKVIKICTDKLERIKDPDINLRRSVCINNTYFKLQDEVRREKQNKLNNVVDEEERSPRGQRFDDLERIDNELNALNDSLGTQEIMLSDEFLIGPTQEVLKSYDTVIQPCPVSTTPSMTMTNEYMDYSSSRKRHFEDVDDRIVQEVLSHFYNQSTTKLLTTIDEDLINENKKIKLDDAYDVLTDLNQSEQKNESVIKNENNKSDFEIILDALRLNNDNKDLTDRDNLLTDFDTKRFGSGSDSCGQAAIFADLQSTVFHNLMASLET